MGVSIYCDELEKKYFLKSGYCPDCFKRVKLLKSKMLDFDECTAKGLEYGQVGSYRRKSLIASHYVDNVPVHRNAKVEWSKSWYQDDYSCKFCFRDFEITYSTTHRSYDDLYRQ